MLHSIEIFREPARIENEWQEVLIATHYVWHWANIYVRHCTCRNNTLPACLGKVDVIACPRKSGFHKRNSLCNAKDRVNHFSIFNLRGEFIASNKRT